MKFVHIGQMDPRTHEGGVAVFARHLKDVLGEHLEFVHYNRDGMLGKYAASPWLAPAEVGKELAKHPWMPCTAVADGYYGLGLRGIVAKLIIVCHSTYAGWARDWSINPPPSYAKSMPWMLDAAHEQERAYREADQIVAVSQSAQEELWDIYRLDSTLILNGIDANEFQPDELMLGTIVEVAGRDENKGADIVDEIRHKGSLEIAGLGFDGPKPKRWRGHEIALLPSRHEGGPYAQLEAMAMSKKIVGRKTGFLKHVPADLFWGTHSCYWGTFRDLILSAMGGERRDIRQWVLENATLEIFSQKWRELLC